MKGEDIVCLQLPFFLKWFRSRCLTVHCKQWYVELQMKVNALLFNFMIMLRAERVSVYKLSVSISLRRNVGWLFMAE